MGLSLVIGHWSLVFCHLSFVIGPLSLVIGNKLKGRAFCRVSYIVFRNSKNPI
ncbi:MAG: hypothetical protein F6K31_06600 [Symploca sp. SIO2G7]|nr:hypothetical protein [Symploca sp. SIO2G7]